jgi:hypothetical protein
VQVRRALANLGFKEGEASVVLRTVVAILNLGEIEFESTAASGTAAVSDGPALDAFAGQLGLDRDAVAAYLCGGAGACVCCVAFVVVVVVVVVFACFSFVCFFLWWWWWWREGGRLERGALCG